MTSSALVLTSIDEHNIAHVTINRPEKHNALSVEAQTQLLRAFRDLRKNRAVRAVLLTGAGPSFCSGYDTSIFTGARPVITLRRLLLTLTPDNFFQGPMHELRRLPVPVIAVIHGNCFGAGLQLALAADFRFAHPDAQLSILEARLGLIPDLTATVTLPELARIDVVKRLTMTGRIFSAAEAEEAGLVTEVADDPHAAAKTLLAELAARSPDAVAAAKFLFQTTWTRGARASLLAERLVQLRLLVGKNFQLASKAIASKTTPKFRPRSW